MPSAINTNVSSLIAQNAISSNSRAQSSAMQQLSTGLRINGAKDDAAGLSIASKMTSQIKGLDQAVRNANDAISMLQTADGALVAVSDMMQRMRELAVQGASDTNVASDRTALNAEFSQLKTEVSRITRNTQWNGMNILDGSANASTGTFNFQVGSNSSQSISATISNSGFGASTVAAATVNTSTGATQVATTTLTSATSTFNAGDVITLNANGSQFQYTVTDTVAAAAKAANAATAGTGTTTVAAAVAAAIGAKFGGTTGLDVTTATNTIVLTANAANPNGFTASSNTASGGLASLNALDVTTTGNASSAISGLDNAIASTNSQRSGLGAMINRLTYAADNLANVSQNAQASRSRIQDTDYAKTSSELARTQIIAQAATAMLAQANQSQQSVLALLK